MNFRDHWRAVEKELLARGLSHSTIEPFATYSPWLNDLPFQSLVEKIQGFTLVDIYRLWELKSLLTSSNRVEGDILEVGVWRGGTGALLCKFSPHKKVWLADTFIGIVKDGDRDLSYNGGEHADTSFETVEELMSSLKLVNFELLKGVFPDDTGNFIPKVLSLVHIDVDVYESAKQIWNFVHHRLAVGGVIVFDDYGFSSTDGVTSFVNEIRELDNFFFLYNLNGHAIFVKIR